MEKPVSAGPPGAEATRRKPSGTTTVDGTRSSCNPM